MMMGLTNWVRSLIETFKSQVFSNKGAFESEDCLYNNLDHLNKKDLLGTATSIITPNAYNENILHTLRGVSLLSPFYNLAQYTESSVGWVGSQAVLTSTTDLNPFGESNAVNLREAATTNVHLGANSPGLTIVSGKTYTFSIYLKKGPGAGAPDIMQYQALNGFTSHHANFDINLGTVTLTSNCTAAISSAPNGWWRCSITVTATSTVFNNQTRLIFCNNNPTAGLAPSYLGATNRDVLFIGIQTEESASVTTYQPVLSSQSIEQGYAQFLRASTAYRTNPSGYVTEVPEQNLIFSSDNLRGPLANWSLVNNTVSPFVEIAPDGTMTASKVTRTAASHRVQLVAGTSDVLTSVNNYVFSIYAKASEGTTITLSNSSSFLDPVARFNLTSGTIETFTGCTASIDDAGNGWWRCAIYVTNIALNNVMFIHNSNINEGIFVWGAQVTIGITLPIYFPTINRRAIARIDYDDSCPSVLVEGFSTNYLLRSEEFDNVLWIKDNITVTQNSELGPNNLLEADTLSATSPNATIKQNGQVFSSNNARDFSVYIKRKTGSGNIIIENGINTSTYSLLTSDWIRAIVKGSIISGTFSASGTSYTVTTSTPHGLDTGDAIRFDVTAGGVPDQNVGSITVTSPTQFTFTGTSVTSTSSTCNIIAHNGRIRIVDSGDEIYAWGAQLSNSILHTSTTNNTFSYTKTITTTSTTPTENLNVKSGISTDYTLYCKIKRIGGANSSNLLFLALGDSPNTINPFANAIGLYAISTFQIAANNRVNSVTNANNLLYQPSENNYFTCVITISGGLIDIWLDGSKVISYVNSNADKFNYLSFGGSQPLLRIKEVYAWQRKLSDLEVSFLNEYPYYNPGYSPVNIELQQIINRASYEGFTLPSVSILSHCDTLITNLKSIGYWNKCDLIYNFAYNDATLSNFSRINWKNPNSGLGLATFNGGLTYNVNGILGNGANAFVDTNFNPSIAQYNYLLNSAHMIALVSSNSTNNVITGVAGTNVNLMYTGSGTKRINNSNAVNLGALSFTGIGMMGLSRDSSTNVNSFVRENTATNIGNSNAIYNGSQLLLRERSVYSSNGIGFFSMGSDVTNTEFQNLRTHYNTFLTNIGLSAYA